MRILVAGGTGFIGRHLCETLLERDHDVVAGSRSPPSTSSTSSRSSTRSIPKGWPSSLEFTRLDVTDPDLTDIVSDFNAVVNLVALPSHVQPRRSHDEVHRKGTRHLVDACEAAGVDRFLQLSGLGVESDVKTDYFAAKREAERIVRQSSLEWVIARPSVVFGEGAGFLQFVRRLSMTRITPLPSGGSMRMQPIWVGDLTHCLADCVDDDTHVGTTYQFGGPEVLTLAEIVKTVRPSAVVVPVPLALTRVGATVADWLPLVPLGKDQYRVQRLDNTVEDNDVTVFGLKPADLTTLEEYLAVTDE